MILSWSEEAHHYENVKRMWIWILFEDTKPSEIAGILLKRLREYNFNNMTPLSLSQVFPLYHKQKIVGVAIVSLICNRPVSAVSPKWKAF